MKQDEALDLLKLGHNAFLTGAAGAGKTYLLNKYVRYLKEHGVGVAITASTGIAATHLGGSTIHAFSGIGIRDTLSAEDLDAIARNSRVRRNFQRTKVLIIDEISMLHARQLDMVDQVGRHILQTPQPFGGVQVVLCGDFFQLPPVVRDGLERKFAYEAAAWTTGNFQICYLHEQHRQGDDPLLTVLNQIRDGSAGEETRIPLRTRYKKEPLSSQANVRPTILYPRNVDVDSINDIALDKLPGTSTTFTMTSHGFGKLVEGLKKSCLAPENLNIKVGAEVLFVKNASDGSYVNGTRGVITGFSDIELEGKEEGSWPIVSTLDGDTIIAYPDEWRYEENGIVQAAIQQVPLRLAWAITIHKSQGMTLDSAEIDLSDAFEPGMGYVALSRVRSLSGLKLMGLNEVALQVNSEVLEQDKIFKILSRAALKKLEELSLEEKKRDHDAVLFERFEGTREQKTVAKPKGVWVKKRKSDATPTHEITGGMVEQKMPLDEIARQRGLTIGTIVTHLEKLKGLNKLPNINYVRATLPQDDFESIVKKFKQAGDGKLAPIFETFEGKHSFDTLKIVRLFVDGSEESVVAG